LRVAAGPTTNSNPNVSPEIMLEIMLEACQQGRLDRVRKLVEDGFGVNRANDDGWAGLHVACQANKIYVVKYLIKHKANVEGKTNDGTTPLHLACENGHLDVVTNLIKPEGPLPKKLRRDAAVAVLGAQQRMTMRVAVLN